MKIRILLAAVLISFGIFYFTRFQEHSPQPPPAQVHKIPIPRPHSPAQAPPAPEISRSENVSSASSAVASKRAAAASQAKAGQIPFANVPTPPVNPKAPRDPVARVALSFVGADSDAEDYWVAAINDPSLPAQERQNLIEDLNEDGLSDPKNPTLEDLPLILSRLELLDDIRPYAMDKINADAFDEAYKDLINLAERTTGGGHPVN